MLKRLLMVAVLVSFFISSSLLAGQDKEAVAVNAANAWLYAVDAGKYAESWGKTSSYFKNAVSKSQWETVLTSTRKPLGEVLSRKVTSKQYTTSLPGAPDGDYVVIQYETSFQNKASSIETVTPSLEEDGVWRVSGYFIK
jgi:uncharacterized protein DUF4019